MRPSRHKTLIKGRKALGICFLGVLVAMVATPAQAKFMAPNMVLDPYFGDPTHLNAHLHFFGQGTMSATVTSCSTVIAKDGTAVSGYVTTITGLPLTIEGNGGFNSAEFSTSASDPTNTADTATVTCFFNKGKRTSGSPTGSVSSSAEFCNPQWSNCP
jgi:hypothetical protein